MKHVIQLFNNPTIINEMPPFNLPNKVRDIGMDQIGISYFDFIATRGLGPCMAVCSRGTTLGGKKILTLAHTSGVFSLEKVIKLSRNILFKRNCINVDTYVVGGMNNHQNLLNDDEQNVVDIANANNIVGVHFNEIQDEDGEDSLTVVFTNDRLYYTTEEVYESANKMGSGSDLYEFIPPLLHQ